jgi:hypothetical protein
VIYLQRARRLILLFAVMFMLPIIVLQIGVTNVWLVWLSGVGLSGLIIAAFFAIIVQVILAFRRWVIS